MRSRAPRWGRFRTEPRTPCGAASSSRSACSRSQRTSSTLGAASSVTARPGRLASRRASAATAPSAPAASSARPFRKAIGTGARLSPAPPPNAAPTSLSDDAREPEPRSLRVAGERDVEADVALQILEERQGYAEGDAELLREERIAFL